MGDFQIKRKIKCPISTESFDQAAMVEMMGQIYCHGSYILILYINVSNIN